MGALIGAPLLYLAFYLTGIKWGAILVALLAYEAWTILNGYKADTISEAVWALSRRPLVPWLFGLATGWAITSSTVTDPWLLTAIVWLESHFFFQAQAVYDEAAKE